MPDFRRFVIGFACAASLLLPGRALHAQENRILTGALGGAAGLVSGGYVSVGVLVARARIEGFYVQSAEDFLSWHSLPVLLGTATGATLGFAAPERLVRSVIVGAAGTVTGFGVGMVVGSLIWEGETDAWAGAAIGAAAGLVVGSLTGAAWPTGNDDEAAGSAPQARSAVPILLRIRF